MPDTSLINKNTGFNATGDTTVRSLPTGNAPTTGATGADNTDLQGFLTTNLDPYAKTIMQQYNDSKNAAAAAAASNAKTITDTGNYNLDYQSEMDKAAGTSALEAGRGFTINPGQLKILSDQSTKRIRDLTQQMNDALASNNSDLYSKLSDLALSENTAITNARTTFLNQYFQGKQEQRAEQSFQTPQQAAVTTLITSYPDAGISANDDINTAMEKVRNSPTYKLNISKGETDIKTALQNAAAATTSAGAAATQAETQRRLTDTALSMVNNIGPSDPNVSGLLNGTITPQQVIESSQNMPGGLGGAYISGLQKYMTSQGYDWNKATQQGAAQEANARSLGAGGYSAISAGATNVLGGFLGSAFGTNPLNAGRSLGTGNSVLMTGPGGTFLVPQSQVATMRANGYK